MEGRDRKEAVKGDMDGRYGVGREGRNGRWR